MQYTIGQETETYNILNDPRIDELLYNIYSKRLNNQINIYSNGNYSNSIPLNYNLNLENIIDTISQNLNNSIIIFTSEDNFVVAVNIYNKFDKYNFIVFYPQFINEISDIYIISDPNTLNIIQHKIHQIKYYSEINNNNITQAPIELDDGVIINNTVLGELNEGLKVELEQLVG